MKKLVIILNLAMVFLASCASQKGLTYIDDVYADPKEIRAEEAKFAAEQKKKLVQSIDSVKTLTSNLK